MLSSFPVKCPHHNCGWSGNVVPSLLRGGADAEIESTHQAWFQCPFCQNDWEVRITNDKVTISKPISSEELFEVCEKEMLEVA